MSKGLTGLTKQQRITAFKMAEEILSRPIPAVVLRHHQGDNSDDDMDLIEERALHIIGCLRADARDLWDES